MSGALNPLLGYAAGALTILSPCVLPLIPLVLGSAAQANRWGPLALAGGLVASFTLAGFALATAGASAGFDGEIVRMIGAAALGVAGLVLLLPQAQHAFERVAAPISGWAAGRQAGLEKYGLAGQAGIGALLGLVWSPCVGPTLGAATVLASQGESLGAVAGVMFAFGMGIATVMLLIAMAGRQMIVRIRGRLMRAGSGGRRMLGGLLVAVAILIGTGLDRVIEGAIVAASPDWLITASTAI
jgi:cytochrome c biogenesis protein CcdA